MIGWVVDASVIDAIVTGRPDAVGELSLARSTSSPVWCSVVALAEVRALRPQLLEQLYELVEHPSVVRRWVDAATSAEIEALSQRTGTFDVAAAHTVLLARDFGAPVLTADSGRLRRIAPDLDIVEL